MVCFTVPFYRQRRIAGVVTVDLSVKYFERLGRWLRELDFGQRSYGFVMSGSGVYIAHPHADYDFASLAAAEKAPRSITELDGADEDFRALARRMLDETRVSGMAVDPSTGTASSWLSARVRPAGWTVVAVIDETEE